MEKISGAVSIAKEALISCYRDQGICAGLHQFNDFWARDSFFASFGALALKDYDIVKKNLNYFLQHMHEDGQIPITIGKTRLGIVLAYLNINIGKRKPRYRTYSSNHIPTDQNSLFIISCYEYILSAKDNAFVQKNIYELEKALVWNFSNDKDNDLLIEEREYSNWADSVKKRGKVLYTNICHCHALKCLSEMFHMVKENEKARIYKGMHENVKKVINEVFWQGAHYLDFVDDEKTANYFSSDGNILAVLWDIANHDQKIKIEECLNVYDMDTPLPTQCVHPYYPKNQIGFLIRLIGLSDYHNGLCWLWLGAINAMAKQQTGNKEDAIDTLNNIAEVILKYKDVYEVYDQKGRPVKRLFYKAEHPFAWSAGLYLYAVSKITNLI